jgi:spore germination protein GerM
LKGPTTAEQSQFPDTEFPLTGVTLTSASLSNGILTLTFNDPQNRTSGGSCRVSVLRAQIEATAKQFGGVNSVRFMPANLFQP